MSAASKLPSHIGKAGPPASSRLPTGWLGRSLLAGLLIGLSSMPGTGSAKAESALPSHQILAPGVILFPGAPEAPSPANRGEVGNVVAFIGATGVVVVGTGASDRHGEHLRAALAAITAKPVLLAIDAYAAPEHALGNTAFARRHIPILAHRETDAYLVRNCGDCISAMEQLVGQETLAGSKLKRPGQTIEGATTLSPGGRPLEVLHFSASHQPGSVAVFDRESGTLYAGGMASFDVIPDARDADLNGWLAALKEIQRLPLRQVVPGRGPAGKPERLNEVAEYLTALQQQTRRAYDEGASLGEATSRITLPKFKDWAGYEPTHRGNVNFEFLRLEARELGQQN
jgi:glyoxylase-like metal-dependent hydrolase (beta-lactamase superfamily II)